MAKNCKPLTCDTCESMSKGVFCGLKNDQMEGFTSTKVTNIYKKGQTIFFQGNPSFGIYCINSGKIKISKTGSSGKETILRIAGPGDILGHQQLLTGENFIATATVIEEAKICFIDKKYFMQAIEQYPSISLNIIRILGKEINSIEERAAAMSHKNVRERLAELLLMLKATYGLPENGRWKLNIKLTREEMASMVGTANETVIRFISEFREEGIIEQDGKTIYLVDVDKLAKTANVYS